MNKRSSLPTSRGTVALAVVATAAIALTGCTAGAESGSAAPSTDTIRVAITGDPTTFAPHLGRNINDYDFSRLLFDNLISRGPDNALVPSLASEWGITPTGGVFTIRDDATCADGTPITPTVVANSLNFFQNPENRAGFRQEAMGPGEVTVTADDAAGTVSIELSQAWTDLLQGLTLAGTGIVCPAGLEDPEGLAAGTVEAAFSGPYTLTKSQPGVGYEFTLREDYDVAPETESALKGAVPTTIDAAINANSSSVSNELLTGTKDVATIMGKDLARFENESTVTAQLFPQATTYVIFNERPGSPFEDPELRKAVAMAIDRKAYMQAMSGGVGEPYVSFAPPGIECATTDAELTIGQDLDAAKELLSGVSITFPGLNIIGPNGSGNSYVAEALREVGADVTHENTDIGTWATVIDTEPENWDLTIYGALNSGGTMNGVIAPFIGVASENGGRNITGSVAPEIETLAAEAMTLVPGDERCGVYESVQEIAMADAHAIPLGPQSAMAVSRNGFSVEV
uniref:ABC transporter substrate-binding protein n=1 Tax=Mycetocola sp. TaxID=1871042 RepID=UPI003989B0F2